MKYHDLVSHYQVSLVPINTLNSFVDCFGFNVVILNHSRMGVISLRKLGTILALVPRRGSALSACCGVFSLKPAVFVAESSVFLSSSDSESL